MKKVRFLAIGAHHDDVELGTGGALLRMKSQGHFTAMVILTRGEMNSRATPAVISSEAQKSAKLLRVDAMETLDLGDTKIEDNYTNRIIVSELIRKYRPDVVLSPYYSDRHKDHAVVGELVRDANMYSRLKKLESNYAPHETKLFLYYLLQVRNSIPPTFVIDISDFFEEKMKAVRSYRSQFEKTASEQGVIPIGIGDYLFHIESRDRYYGSLINAKYGEAFISDQPLNIKDFVDLV